MHAKFLSLLLDIKKDDLVHSKTVFRNSIQKQFESLDFYHLPQEMRLFVDEHV